MNDQTNVGSHVTLPLDRFWRWLKDHHRCIVRAGGSEAFLYDHDSLHWHLSEDPDRSLLVQLYMGKELLGELVIEPSTVSLVQATPEGTDNNVMFELISGDEEPFAAYHFVLAHGFEDAQGHEGYKH
jgi:hypothetical protein